MARPTPTDFRPVRVAAVGLGWVTTHRHLPAMRATGLYDIVGVIDRRPGRAETVARSFDIPRYSTAAHLADVPWLDEVEAISIGTSPFSHYELMREAINRGKDAITEKPFTMSLAEGEDLVAAAREAGRVIGVVHNFQFARSLQRLERDIAAGRLGTIRAILAQQLGNPRRRLPEWYEDLPFGLFYDESPHFFYLLRCLAPGELSMLRADALPSTVGRASPASIVIQFTAAQADGAAIPVTMQMLFEAPVSEWHITVLGDRALGDVDIFRDIYVRLPNDRAHTTATVVRTSAYATMQHWAQHLTRGPRHLRGTLLYGNETVFERFARAVRAGTAAEAIGPEDALTILRMQHAVLTLCQMHAAPPAT